MSVNQLKSKVVALVVSVWWFGKSAVLVAGLTGVIVDVCFTQAKPTKTVVKTATKLR